ncbi:MAG TPA: hypothetical protein VGE39_10110, partial [Prosthecobacter sp.]
AFEISEAQLKDTRFMMVDLLGQEELGIIYFVPNWSIGAALNARLQSLTFAEVLRADATGSLEEELLKTDWMQNLCVFYDDIHHDGLPPLPSLKPTAEHSTPQQVLLQKIQAAHPLRWVRSTPAVRKDLFSAEALETNRGGISGWIDATTHLRLAPGHQAKAKTVTDNVRHKRDAADATAKGGGIDEVQHERDSASPMIKLPADPEESDDIPSFTIHQLGASDLALPQRSLKPYDPGRLMPVSVFLAQVHDLMEMSCGSGEAGQRGGGRDIVGITTFCGIPVPALKERSGQCLFSPGYDPAHHVAVLEIILPVLKRRLMLGDPPTLKTRPEDEDLQQVLDEWKELEKQTALRPGHQRAETWGALSAFDIGEKTRRCCLPQPLVRTLEFVYHNFTTLLANPFAFDSVLDLYDIFVSFHRALTRELPELCGDHSPLENQKVEMIARLIDAVHRALGHRMYRLFPENSHRDMDIDFRGGLNALVYSADGISKLGAGVLRHHVLEHSNEDRARVGVVTRIGFRQGIFALALRLGVESETRLGIVETDVPHLYHLPSYVDFLHESFHLAYDAARNPSLKDPRPPMLPTVPRDDEDVTLESRLAEIFANMLTALFVCPEDPEILAEHMVLQYTVRSARVSDKVVRGNFIELTCLLYVMCSCLKTLRGAEGRAADKSSPPWWFCADEKAEEELAMNFTLEVSAGDSVKFFEKYLPYFSSQLQKNAARNISVQKSLWDQVKVIFDELYTLRLRKYVPMVVARVCLIYSRYWLRSAGRLTDMVTYKERGLEKEKDSAAEGQEKCPTAVTPEVFDRKVREFTLEWNAVNDQVTKEVHKIFNGGPCKPFSFLTWRSRNPDYPKGRLDPMILLGVLLGETLRSRSEELKKGDGPRHLPQKAGAPSFKDFKHAEAEADRPRFFIQRGVSALFTSDFECRARRLGSRITTLKMFGDMASLLRSKRFSEMLFRCRSEEVKLTR